MIRKTFNASEISANGIVNSMLDKPTLNMLKLDAIKAKEFDNKKFLEY
jgi:hypothetical protein